jgi:hypothetical protein
MSGWESGLLEWFRGWSFLDWLALGLILAVGAVAIIGLVSLAKLIRNGMR